MQCPSIIHNITPYLLRVSEYIICLCTTGSGIIYCFCNGCGGTTRESTRTRDKEQGGRRTEKTAPHRSPVDHGGLRSACGSREHITLQSVPKLCVFVWAVCVCLGTHRFEGGRMGFGRQRQQEDPPHLQEAGTQPVSHRKRKQA